MTGTGAQWLLQSESEICEHNWCDMGPFTQCWGLLRVGQSCPVVPPFSPAHRSAQQQLQLSRDLPLKHKEKAFSMKLHFPTHVLHQEQGSGSKSGRYCSRHGVCRVGVFFGFEDEEMSPPSTSETGCLCVLPQADKSGLLHRFWWWNPSSTDAVRLQAFF